MATETVDRGTVPAKFKVGERVRLPNGLTGAVTDVRPCMVSEIEGFDCRSYTVLVAEGVHDDVWGACGYELSPA